ncbi:unnamed protein product, partial [Ascophyllum nodosum]
MPGGRQITEVELILASKNAEVKDLKTDRDSHRVKSEELKEALEASKAREEATSARLAETLVELEATEEEAAAKRAKASAFRENASSAATEVSGAVARFAGKHSEGCQGLRESLIDAEVVAKAAT